MTKFPVHEIDLDALAKSFERSGYIELRLMLGQTSVRFARTGAGTVEITQDDDLASGNVSPEPASAGQPDIGQGMAGVAAPATGTFYRSPHPGAPPFCEPGQTVAATDTLCLVEVMKLFTSVRAETAGIVRRALADDGDLVQAGQVLFEIEPD